MPTHVTYPLQYWNSRQQTFNHQMNDIVSFIKALPITETDLQKTYIAGGSVKDFALDNVIAGDVDLFFGDDRTCKSVLAAILDDATARDIMRSDYSTSLSIMIGGRDWNFQLVHRKFYETVQDVLDDFDLTVCQFAVGFKDNSKESGHLWTTDEALWDTARGQMNLIRIDRPFQLMKRISKYEAKGFKLSNHSRKKYIRFIADNTLDAHNDCGKADDFY